MNIFEGFRRISKIFIGIWIFGSIIGAFNNGFRSYPNNSEASIFDTTTFLLCIIGGSIFILIFSYVIGWIVRGFMGIPQGQDKKPE